VTAHRAEHAAPAPLHGWRAWLDWLAGSDPGLMRLQLAGEVTVSIGIVVAAEWGFVRATGALQAPVPSGAPAAVAAQVWAVNHTMTVIAMMFGAIVAMLGGFAASMYTDARGKLVTYLFIPVPMIAALALGLSLHVRVLSLASLAVLLAIGTYCRRFGPRGFMGGMVGFMGAFFGYFIQKLAGLGDIGWLSAEVGVGIAVTIVVHFALFHPRPGVALRRMQRSYAARVRDVAGGAADLFTTLTRSREPQRHRSAEKKLRRQLLRLNEAALLIDSRLGNRAAIPPGRSGAALHQQLFDAEVALSNAARFALAIARRRLPGPMNTLIADALVKIRDADRAGAQASAHALQAMTRHAEGPALPAQDRVLVERFVTSVEVFCAAMGGWLRPARTATARDTGDVFRTQVATFGGWLPGSSLVSAEASAEGGAGLVRRIRMAPYARFAIQMGIAVGVATAAGDALSGPRFYWAVIAAFITFFGTNTASEQLRKGLFRVAGTFIGVIVGSVLAHLAGDRLWLQIAVVLIALFLGLYLFRVNYTFMTIGITVMVAQLYVELGEFSNGLLLVRLEETALGAGVAMATVLLVFPLHVGRVARVAARQHLEALADLTDRCLDRFLDPASSRGSDEQLRAAARRLDNAYQALVATVWPMRTPLLGRQADRIAGFMQSALAARHYARDLILHASPRDADLDGRAAAEVGCGRRQLADSVSALTAALRPGGAAGRYVRSASLFAEAAGMLTEQDFASRPQLALRDLQLLDAALAQAAGWAGVPVTDPSLLPSAVVCRGRLSLGGRAEKFPVVLEVGVGLDLQGPVEAAEGGLGVALGLRDRGEVGPGAGQGRVEPDRVPEGLFRGPELSRFEQQPAAQAVQVGAARIQPQAGRHVVHRLGEPAELTVCAGPVDPGVGHGRGQLDDAGQVTRRGLDVA
jgi:uncharacterized membrane protein YccC